jgi:hypothetical protein
LYTNGTYTKIVLSTKSELKWLIAILVVKRRPIEQAKVEWNYHMSARVSEGESSKHITNGTIELVNAITVIQTLDGSASTSKNLQQDMSTVCLG